MHVRNEVLKQYVEYLFKYNTVSDGFHIVLKFENGYGISFINHSGSYGQEIAKIVFDKNGMTYEISNDILPHLKNFEVFEAIEQVKSLEAI